MRLYKDIRNNWSAESTYTIDNIPWQDSFARPTYVLRVRTYKVWSGHIVTYAEAWKQSGNALTRSEGQDYGRKLAMIEARCTQKNVSAAHVHNPVELLTEARAFYAANKEGE